MLLHSTAFPQPELWKEYEDQFKSAFETCTYQSRTSLERLDRTNRLRIIPNTPPQAEFKSQGLFLQVFLESQIVID